MSGLTAGSEQLSSRMRRQNALTLLFFLCAAAALLIRFTVSQQLMNMVVNYTEDGGPFYQKLHLGTYAIFFLCAVVLFSRPFLLRGDEISVFKALLRYSVLVFVLVPYLFAAGRAGASGFVVDTYLVAGAAGLMMLALNEDARRALGDVVLVTLILSAAIGIMEVATQHRLLPFTESEPVFRPIGLAGHPLALGGQCAIAIGFVASTRWRIWVRLLSILILFVGTAASGARTALILTVGEIFILLMFVRWPRLTTEHQREAKFVVLLFTAVIGVAMVAVMLSAGLLSRFDNTIFDANFMARVTIYQVFGLVSWKDILFGMDANELLRIVNEQLGLPHIESAPVVFGLLFGVPIAILFFALILWLIFKLLREAPLPARVATTVFLLASLSNNALSSKTPDVTIMVVLLIATRKPQEVPPAVTFEQARGRSG